MLKKTGWDFKINDLGRKLKPEEIAKYAENCEALIAGTEKIDILIEKAKNLKIISRVGIGLDSVPLALCKKKGITVCYTPDAVTKAVSELTIGAMISITRFMHQSDHNTRKFLWNRLVGKRLECSVIGIVGLGRIGTDVIRLLSSFNPKKILVNDIKNKVEKIDSLKQKYGLNISQVDLKKLVSRSDLVSLHIPLTSKTNNMFDAKLLECFKKDGFLINYSRGGIVNEEDLYTALKNRNLKGAAVDTFVEEPYKGILTQLDQVLLTQHMGSCSFDCRTEMELQATEEVIRFFKKQPLLNEVPMEEFLLQEEF